MRWRLQWIKEYRYEIYFVAVLVAAAVGLAILTVLLGNLTAP